MYLSGQFLQGNMWMAFRFSVAFVFSLCFVKLDLSLHVGLCATSILRGQRSLAVISDVVCMQGSVCVCFIRDRTSLQIKIRGYSRSCRMGSISTCVRPVWTVQYVVDVFATVKKDKTEDMHLTTSPKTSNLLKRKNMTIISHFWTY